MASFITYVKVTVAKPQIIQEISLDEHEELWHDTNVPSFQRFTRDFCSGKGLRIQKVFGSAQQGGKAGLRLRFFTTLCSRNSHPSDSATHSKIPRDPSRQQSSPTLCNVLPSSAAPSPCTHVTKHPTHIPAHADSGEAQLKSSFPPRYSPCNTPTARFDGPSSAGARACKLASVTL